MIMVTMGSDGVLVYNGVEFKHFNGKHLGMYEVKSVVGAGDSFLGGFTAGLLLDKTLAESIEIGQLCAEMTLRSEKNVSLSITAALLKK
jgi:sugar/nucleoside kinase (ribokinase family)